MPLPSAPVLVDRHAQRAAVDLARRGLDEAPDAGPFGLGYYSYTAGPWRVIALNSEIAVGPGSAQLLWLRTELMTGYLNTGLNEMSAMTMISGLDGRGYLNFGSAGTPP